MQRPSKKLKPFITYLDDGDHARLKKFAKAKKMTMAKVIREGVLMRMAGENPYLVGNNDAISSAQVAIQKHTASQMKFPSGQSFGDLMCDELSKLYLKE
jgi:hypothetical protein